MRFVYSAVLTLLLPLIVLRMLWRSRRAPAYRRRLAERLGFFEAPAGDRPLLWVHAVSLGETLAARPLIERLLQQRPDLRIAVTTTTPTGSAQVQTLFGGRVFHVYAPWDTPGAVRRALARLRPTLLVLMETELWPNLLAQARGRGCRVLLANARLSARSAAGYARVPGLTRSMLSALDLIAAQSEADRARFEALGAAPAQLRVSGSIKFDLAIGEEQQAAVDTLRAAWHLAGRPVVVAASTHDPEEALVLAAFQTLREQRPEALLVLAPRHPERFGEVAQLCQRSGLSVCLRSFGDAPDAQTAVLLLDTLGELLLFYGLADVAVIGGSFLDRGGHNPLEAAAWGVPVLCGESLFNFQQIAGQLAAQGALQTVPDGDALARELLHLCGDAGERQRRGAAGRAVVAANRGAEASLYRFIEELLP